MGIVIDPDLLCPIPSDGFDIGRAMSLFDSDRRLWVRLLLSFEAQHGQAPQNLARLLAKSQTDELGVFLHRLKGVVSTLCAHRLLMHVERLELLCSEGLVFSAAWQETMMEFHDAHSDAIQAVRAMREEQARLTCPKDWSELVTGSLRQVLIQVQKLYEDNQPVEGYCWNLLGLLPSEARQAGVELLDGVSNHNPALVHKSIQTILRLWVPAEAYHRCILPSHYFYEPSLLIIDDERANLKLLNEVFKSDYRVSLAQSGAKGLEIARQGKPDLILLDVNLPEMDGYQILNALKSDSATADIPVIFATALNSDDDETKGLSLGAVDYVTKPYRIAILKSRIRIHIELAEKRRRSRELLLNVFPESILNDLEKYGTTRPREFHNVSVMFTDIVGFTDLAAHTHPEELITDLNEFFSAYDEIIAMYGCERIKTIGDCYLSACGLSEGVTNPGFVHLQAVMEFYKWLVARNQSAKTAGKRPIQVRTGLHIGTVVGAVVGHTRYMYDIFGDAVNVASRIESSCEPGQISCSQAIVDAVNSGFSFTSRGDVEIRGRGYLKLYYLNWQ